MASGPVIDGTELDGPLRLMTHERCSDPCPHFRDRIDGSDAFEFSGMWGPKIETADGEMIAEGHESVRLVLNAVLGDESPTKKTCSVYDCDAEATHTAEFDSERAWFTVHYCSDCTDTELEANRSVDVVLDRSRIHLFDTTSGDALVHGLTEYDPRGGDTGRTGTQAED